MAPIWRERSRSTTPMSSVNWFVTYARFPLWLSTSRVGTAPVGTEPPARNGSSSTQATLAADARVTYAV